MQGRIRDWARRAGRPIPSTVTVADEFGVEATIPFLRFNHVLPSNTNIGIDWHIAEKSTDKLWGRLWADRSLGRIFLGRGQFWNFRNLEPLEVIVQATTKCLP
jgi:hypothetical protein